MTELHEHRIPHHQLLLVSLRCQACEGELILDIMNQKQTKRLDSNDPIKCPLCSTPFHGKLYEALQKFQEWANILKASGQEIVFCVREIR